MYDPKKKGNHYLLLWGIGLLFVLARGKIINMCNSNLVCFDPWAIITIYIFMYYGLAKTVFFAFSQGLFLDIFSCGVHGLFVILYVFISGCIYIGSNFFDLDHTVGQISLVTLVMLLKDSMFFLLTTVFVHNSFSLYPFIYTSIYSAILTGIAAPFFFHVFFLLAPDNT
jgi:cell shape-determining protein MreD